MEAEKAGRIKRHGYEWNDSLNDGRTGLLQAPVFHNE
jgi:hypothetical protein